MRYLRLIISLLFVVSVVLSGFSVYRKHAHADSTMPVIEGSSEILQISCDYNDEDLLKGLSAYDEKDGDITDEIIIGNFSSFYDKGKCNLDYAVFDSSNNPAAFSRKIEFTDYHSPRIDISSPLIFKENSVVKLGDNFSAYDVFDGDISSEIRITDTDINFESAGDYKLKIELINSFGDFVEFVFPVHVMERIDKTYEINLKQNIVYISKGDEFDPASMIENIKKNDGTVVDLSDYDSSDFRIDSELDINESGIYEVKYTFEYSDERECFTILNVVVE